MASFKIIWQIIGVELAVRGACVSQEMSLAATQSSLLRASKFLVPQPSSFAKGPTGKDPGDMTPAEVEAEMHDEQISTDSALIATHDQVDTVTGLQKEMMKSTTTVASKLKGLADQEKNSLDVVMKTAEGMNKVIEAARTAEKADVHAVREKEQFSLQDAEDENDQQRAIRTQHMDEVYQRDKSIRDAWAQEDMQKEARAQKVAQEDEKRRAAGKKLQDEQALEVKKQLLEQEKGKCEQALAVLSPSSPEYGEQKAKCDALARQKVE
eukprot:gnl/MRDRNA2_/MRDRNA2_106210_c0_seq1.p1 gnl/MRDRNA2_/MRDRNA2_106210_c0~~gnl/MRDRNA2_/MRDRNA2_106210_c0_seq1.p1  ORF type:complete len:285 (-),score=85.51 gnl/MRDRNA2_/MRDRNA2_106210_c0_seq1:6-806(-)